MNGKKSTMKNTCKKCINKGIKKMNNKELEISLYYALKFSKNDNALKNNILRVLFNFEENEEKKKLLFKLIND